jgi:hypothetical protein
MKDYMDWDYYYGLQAQLKEVNQKLEALNWGSFFIALVSTLWVRVLICCAGKQKNVSAYILTRLYKLNCKDFLV